MLTGPWPTEAVINRRRQRCCHLLKLRRSLFKEYVVWGNLEPIPSPVAFLLLLP